MKLLTSKQLSKEIGMSPWWLVQAKKAGMPFMAGGRITVQDAVQWMRDHPDFCASDYTSEPTGSGRGRPRKVVDKSRGQCVKNGQQTSSPETLEHPHVQAA